MKLSNHKIWLLAALGSIAVTVLAFHSRDAANHRNKLAALPPVMLWAWERPEKLNFIDSKKVGVAFLAKTIFLKGDAVNIRPRLQPLEVPDGTKTIAVVRLESDRSEPPTLSHSQLESTSAEISKLAKLPNLSGIQIDFDATVSQRPFYRELLQTVHSELPSALPLSITALASWCDGDNWIKDLPIDEAVPMFFRMGVDQRQFASRLKSGDLFLKSPCQGAAGVSLDEPMAKLTNERLYIFNPASWTETTVNDALEAYYK